MVTLKRILAPIDFSDYSLDAAETAAEIASKFDAELILFHAVPAVPGLDSAKQILNEGEHREKLNEETEERLQAMARGFGDKGIRVKTEIGEANEVGMEILRNAEANAVDLIVIATHGMTGWHKVVFGSVAEKVAEQAKCPVLILRAQESDEKQQLGQTSTAAA
jgi:nucleotide-binding universal stress UspA family protein